MTARGLELEIGGMTCASCANRIEKKLNKLDGVEATVNYATEKARVSVPEGYDAQLLIAEVEKTGYTAALPAPPASASASADNEGRGSAEPADPELSALRQRLIGSVALSVPVIAMAMIPALQFQYWQWLSLTLTAPVIVWAGWPFHRAAWVNMKHGAATMDTLVSVGTIAAFLWSLYALFFGHAGMPGMTHAFEFGLQRGDGASNIYLETAAGVTMFLLAGRYFEKRSKRQAGAALRALLELGAKDVAILAPDGSEARVPIEQLQVGDEFVVRPGEKIVTDGVIVSGHSAVDASILTGESVPVEAGPGDAATGGTVSTSGRLVVLATRIGAALMIGLIRAVFAFLQFTTYGMVVRAGMRDRETVGLLGIDIERRFTVVFGLAAVVAGVAGVMYTPILPPDYHMGMEFLVLSFVVVVVGGMGSLEGAVLAGFLLGILQSFAAMNEVKALIPGIDQVVIYAVAAVILLLRPRGLMGRKGLMES